jgi:glycosyltransferase involved in cell wall biosynthesis
VDDRTETNPDRGDAGPLRQIRVLAAIPSSFCFGLQNITLALFGKLSKRIEMHCLNTRWSDGEFARRLENLGIKHSATWLGMFSRKLDAENLRMTAECLLKLPIAWKDFLRLYYSFRPDIIYLANHHEVILLWPVLIWLRRRVVCHMHDPPPPVTFQRVSFHIWRWAVGRFVFISDDAGRRLSKLGRLRKHDVVLHNGVEVMEVAMPRVRNDRFAIEQNWPRGTLIVGMTGQMHQRKGHEDFLGAARRLNESGHEVRFVIGGKQQEPFFSQLEKIIKEVGLDGHVLFTGWQSAAKDFYEAIDILVMPSRHEEGFGLVVAEAGERGIPVVATRSGGAVEVIDDGSTGMLVSKKRPQEIADAISSLLHCAGKRRRMGEAARRKIEREFNLRIQAERFEDLLVLTAPTR